MSLNKLAQKQIALIKILKCVKSKNYKNKWHRKLSPIGWHIIHCVYIELYWIRSYFFEENDLVSKISYLADASQVGLSKRGKNLPDYNELLIFCKDTFSKNIEYLKKIKEKKIIKNSIGYFYLLEFLSQHHSQHIETLYSILNIKNLKTSKKYRDFSINFDAKTYKYNGALISEGEYIIGSDGKNFAYDNEKPSKIFKTSSFNISKTPIKVSEWYGFILEGGYKKKEYWSSSGWKWKKKYCVEHPLNWKFFDKKLSLSTPNDYISPSEELFVTNISKYELDAFANFVRLRLPSEFEWEIAAKDLLKQGYTWEWTSSNFLPYEGFIPFPYNDYSNPWFNGDYFTLKGYSQYSLKELQRVSFRNFYLPEDRYAFTGGRLCK